MTDLLDDQEVGTEPRRRITFTKVLLTVICLGLVAMWVYAFGFASKDAAYRVNDDAWRAQAQEICQRFEAERLALVDTDAGYIAEPTNAQMLERADVVDRATDLIEAELAELLAIAPTDERDLSLITEYAGYTRTMIADRRAYTARLREFDLQPYGETPVDGGPVSNLLTDFAIVNQIPACAPPGELGGDA